LREDYVSIVRDNRLPLLICFASFKIKISQLLEKRSVKSYINVRQLIGNIAGFKALINTWNEGDSTSDNGRLLDTTTLRINF
jgi:hypothetical protein